MDRNEHLLSKLLGLVGQMRKHQQAYFKHKMEHDKKQSMHYEKLVDDYVRLLIRNGIKPIFEDRGQKEMF